MFSYLKLCLMKKVYLKIAIAISLCDISVYASQSEGSPDPERFCWDCFSSFFSCFNRNSPRTMDVNTRFSAPTENIMHADAMRIEILEEAESIVKGRHAYNAYLLQEMSKIDEEISIVDRITYYSHVSGLDYSTKNQEVYDQIMSNINGDLHKYTFFAEFINNIKMKMDSDANKKEVNVLYAMMQCLCKIDSDNLLKMRSMGIKAEKDDFFETPFLNEIIEFLGRLEIEPAYKRCQDYLSCIDAKTIDIHLRNSKISANLEKKCAEACEKKTEFLTLFGNYKSAISSYHLLELTIKDHVELTREINTEIDAYSAEISRYSPNFDDLRVAAEFMRAFPEPTHALMRRCLQASQRYQEIIKSYNFLIDEINAKNDATMRQKKAEEKEKAEEDAAKKAEMVRKRKEKERKFKEEQALRQREYEERVQARAAAEAARRAAEQAARQQEQLAMRKAATSDIDVSGERAASKVKTRGVAYTATPGDADENQTHIELAQHVVRVIPEDVREFVTEVMEADFDTVKNSFERQMAATVTLTKGNKWVFSFRSPVNNELLRFYADNPHGAQSEKFRTAWRALMQDALERGEMKLR